MKRIYSTPEEHLKHYPEARTSTLAWIAIRNAKTEQVARENAEHALRNKPRLKQEPKMNGFKRFLLWPSWVWR